MTAGAAQPPQWVRTVLLTGAFLMMLIGGWLALGGGNIRLGVILIALGGVELVTVFRLFRTR